MDAFSCTRCDPVAADERGGTSLNAVAEFRAEIGSSQGLNQALTGLFAPSLLDSGGENRGVLGR